MNPKQTQFFNNLQKSLEGGAVQPDEIVEIVQVLLTLIDGVKKDLDNKIVDSSSEANTLITEVSYTLNELELKIKDLINSSERTSLSQIKELSTRLSSEINRIEDSIPTLPDLSSIELKIAEVEQKIPVLKDQIFETPDELVSKINSANTLIKQEKIEGLISLIEDLRRIAIANANALPITTSFVNGLRAKNFNFNGATVSVRGDTAFITTTGGGHTIQDEGVTLPARTFLNFVGAGVVATDDSVNDATKVTISTSAGAGYQQPTSGAIDGSNLIFAFATAPNAIVVDGVSMQKTAGDSTSNWTGTTTITLAVAPTFDIYGVA